MLSSVCFIPEAYRAWLVEGAQYSLEQVARLVKELPGYLSQRAQDMAGPRGLDAALRRGVKDGVPVEQVVATLSPKLQAAYRARQERAAGAAAPAQDGTASPKRVYVRRGSVADLARPGETERRAKRPRPATAREALQAVAGEPAVQQQGPPRVPALHGDEEWLLGPMGPQAWRVLEDEVLSRDAAPADAAALADAAAPVAVLAAPVAVRAAPSASAASTASAAPAASAGSSPGSSPASSPEPSPASSPAPSPTSSPAPSPTPSPHSMFLDL